MDDSVQFNINIADYTMQDLMNLLDIKVTKDTEINDIKKEIKTKTQKYIDQFTDLNKTSIANFFKNVRASLIGTEDDVALSAGEKLLLQYDKSYKPFSNENFITSTENLFSQNSGAGNRLNRKVVSKLLNIDSRFRDSYLTTNSSDFMINLPYTVTNVIETKLCDLELPASYYPINTTNQSNFFWFATYTNEQLINETPYIYYFLVPDGNYYPEELITIMNASFKSIVTPDGYTLPISITYDLNNDNLGKVGSGTGRVTMGIITDEDISLNLTQQIVRVDFNFNPTQLVNTIESKSITLTNEYSLYYVSSNSQLEQKFGWMLGYRNSYYKDSLYYVSESILDVSGPKYLFLIVDDFNQNTNVNFIGTSKVGLLPDDIIARISIKGPPFRLKNPNDYTVYSEPRYYYGPVNIDRLQVKLIDEFGRTLSLNQNDFSFTLKLTTVYSIT
jgi:hypothetical protein